METQQVLEVEMKRDKSWYQEKSTKEHVMRYYKGEYKKRNNIMISLIKNLIPEEWNELKIIDVAAGSSYVAEKLLLTNKVSKYTWNDFNPIIIDIVKDRINDSRFEITSYDIEKDYVNYSDYNLFICNSLEHI